MKVYFARDYNITPKTDITNALQELFATLRADSGEKTLVFDKGKYFLNAEDSRELSLDITNTIGVSEWSKKDKKRCYKSPLVLENTNNLIVDFSGSTLIIKGVVTNMVITNCKNIEVKNVEIKVVNPNLHEVRVMDKTNMWVDYVVDSESLYEHHAGKFYFVGDGYKYSFADRCIYAWWIGDIKPDNLNHIVRTGNPFYGASKMKEIAPYKIRAYYANTSRYEINERFYLYDERRKNVGIFIENSENIVLKKITQRFNYSLAVVCQLTHNLTIDSVNFSPKGAKKMCSLADFIQVCMCSGDVIIKNSNFEGAGDDCLNVHGFHFNIKEVKKNKLVVRFMHPQSYGFLPFSKGDEIAYINKQTLLEVGRAKVVSAKMLSDYDIEVKVDKNVGKQGMAIENVTRNPNLYFTGNKLNRIITRGVLVTTRGHVEITNNIFNDNSMSGILISDDANHWYESGMVKDVLIKQNTFNNSKEYDILIKPENNKFSGYVHSNITIEGNTFNSKNGGGIFVKDTDNVVIKDNNAKEGYKVINKNSNIVENQF